MTSQHRNILWRLLRRNISPGQIIGYALANFVGLAIVITAIQFYGDVTAGWSSPDAMISSDYIIISKPVNGVGALFGNGDGGFSQADVDSIEAQPWCRRLGRFTPSRFDVQASVDMHGRGLSTSMFFESIPDEFFDVAPVDWHFDSDKPGSPIPIIISKDYLALYNFGFAATRGLPQLSESMIELVPLSVSISGNGRQINMPARIVGFSSRLNTIAVPQSFMDWANDSFAYAPAANPSRLIVEVSSPGDPAINSFLQSRGWEAAGDKLNSGKASYFLTLVTSVVIVIGAVISLLAFFILMLSIYLLIQKNKHIIHDLMQLGYTPAAVAACYYKLVAAVNFAVLLAAIAVMLAARRLWSGALSALGAEAASPAAAIVSAAVIIALVTFANLFAVRRLTRRAFFSSAL